MNRFHLRYPLLAAAALSLAGCLDEQAPPAQPATADPALVELGRQLFHETALSANGNQACASCHDTTLAHTDPDNDLPVSAGSPADTFGTRNAPSARYTAFVPPLHAEDDDGDVLWVGGLFLDGRAAGLEAQARQPFFNPREMDLADATALLAKLQTSASSAQYQLVFGSLSGADPEQVLDRVTQAIAAFEGTPEFAPFSAKFDAFLAGTATLTAEETEGMAVFVRPDKGNCAACHTMARGANGEPPMFTDFTYDNLGVPRHPDRDFFAADFIDDGLETTLLANGIAPAAAAQLRGKFRVPSLRNVALTAPYMHNGVFADLRTVVEFYNTRDTDPARWAAIGDTEVPATVNHSELGNLGLSAHDIDVLLAFLDTLSDGYTH